MTTTENLRISETVPLISPAQLKDELPISDRAAGFVADARRQVQDVREGRDTRLLAIVGPCSIHDTEAALEYAARLQELRRRFEDDLMMLMRVYFEKPRTTVGWKGLRGWMVATTWRRACGRLASCCWTWPGWRCPPPPRPWTRSLPSTCRT